MAQEPGKKHYRRYPIEKLSLGINDAINPALLEDGETPYARNVDFNHESVDAHGGAVKFNNQVAPHSGLLTRTSYAPLFIDSGKSVPQRGYAMFPYSADVDFGGDFALYDPGTGVADYTFHARRGKSFDVSVSFALPADEKLYVNKYTAGVDQADAGALGFMGGLAAFDESLEECTIIAQKGGDGLAAMSWALAIVNTGAQFENVTGAPTFDRVSNYALVFMWLDAPCWGNYAPSAMKYLVGAGGANVGSSGRSCTLAYRAVVAKYFIEPGRTYHVAVELKLDTGSPGSGSNPTAAWSQDGTFRIVVRDERGATSVMSTVNTDLFVWKGPSDSVDYLKRYGIRFSGRDAMFAGLGYRFAPWNGCGFLPYGLDSASMEAGGFRMLDVGAQAKPSAYTIAHESSHTSPNDYVTLTIGGVASQGWHGGTATNLPNPLDPTDPVAAPWGGLYDTVAAAIPNQGTAGQSEALRGYWLVLWGGTAAPDTELNGPRVKINYYYESGGTYRFNIATGTARSWSTKQCFVIGFRWHQRPLLICNLRVMDATLRARAWTDARTQFSLASYTLLDDQTEPDREQFVAIWPMDDAGGGVLRELVAGRTGYLCPYALGKTDAGLFLSGEGEAVVLDFEDNPVLRRELGAVLRSGVPAFAIEMRLTMPHAYYARESVASSTRTAKHVPILAEWAVKGDTPGYQTTPGPLIRFGHRARLSSATYSTAPFYFPMGFSAEFMVADDQSGSGAEESLHAWASSTVSNWSTSAEWVGRSIRLQVGVQSAGSSDACTVYIAASPKDALLPAAGDPAGAEFAYFASKTISRRDLARTVICIGGAWRPESYGYLEASARMLIEEVRVFGCAAPGSLPSSTGGIVTNRDGKLIGDRCLPQRDLKRSDLLHPLGSQASGVNATEGSTTVTPSDSSRFFQGEPEATLAAVKETFLLVGSDRLELWKEGTEPVEIEEFYYVSSVATGGASVTLSRNFNDRDILNGSGASFRVIGYTQFEDDIGYRSLSIGKGTPFTPGSTDPSDAVLTEPYFANLAPVTAGWRMRVLASQISAAAIVPQWTRGLGVARRNRVLGMESHQGRLLAVTRGCLYEADDRWRIDGPTEDIKASLAFRARDIGDQDVAAPLHADMLKFAAVTGLIVPSVALTPAHWDAWVWIESYHAIQTVLWVGEVTSNPALNSGSSAGTHKMHLWLRLERGYPSIAIGSTAAYTGVTRPDRGFFVGRAGARVPLRTWTHLRWTLELGVSGGWLAPPQFFVNGRPATAQVDASQTGGATGDWIAAADIITLSSGTALIGCAHDSYTAPEADRTFSDNVLEGRLLSPNQHHGYLHSLDGRIARVVAVQSSTPAFFDPYTLTYSSPRFLALDTPESVGHKVYDSAGAQYGLIESHPAVSLMHEMGMHDNPASWARYGDRLYVTNGGRPVYVQSLR